MLLNFVGQLTIGTRVATAGAAHVTASTTVDAELGASTTPE